MANYKELPYVDVPMKMQKVSIGLARVYESGEITLRISRSSDVGKTLYQFLREGLTSELNLVPDVIPVEDAANATKDADFVKDETVEMPRTFTWADFRKKGLLWLVNRVVFHPRGRALAMVFDEEENATGWQLKGDGKELWAFSYEEEKVLFLEAEKTLRVE